MQFSGLKDLLKRKKEAADSVSSTATAAPSPSAGQSKSGDPYLTAVLTALANKSKDTEPEEGSSPEKPSVSENGRKRCRSPPTDSANDPQESKVAASSPPSSLPKLERPPLLSRAAFEAQRSTMLKALEVCMAYVSKDTEGPNEEGEESSHTGSNASLKVAIPTSLQSFLTAQYVHAETGSAGGAVSPEDTEHAALKAALTELSSVAGIASPSPSSSPVAQQTRQKQRCDSTEAEKLLALIHALWHLTAAYWHSALLGEGAAGDLSASSPTRQSAELMAEYGAIKGWCFPVYLLAAHELPDVMRFTCGREVSTCLDAWRAAHRCVHGALQLLALLLLDYHSICSRVAHEDLPSREGGDRGGGSVAVPLAIRQGLHHMVVTLVKEEGDFAGARQAYTDLTMGNTNWKLGLFTAGEVHMRRSVEKLDRNRVTSLLNNEQAMRLLHATRELVLFAERRGKA